MQESASTSLKNTLLLLPMLATVHLTSACGDSNESAQSADRQTPAIPDNNQYNTAPRGTTPVSSGALFDFLYAATQFEFWQCASSDEKPDTYITLDARDDETDEGFNPLLLLGQLREALLPGDPRALNASERTREVELHTTPVSIAVTGSDSISLTLHAQSNFTSSVEDTMIELSQVRTGPGRTFTAEDQLDNTHLTCSAHNVGADIMM